MRSYNKYFISYFQVKIIRVEISLFLWSCGNDIVNSMMRKLSGFINIIFFLDIEATNSLVDYACNINHSVFGLYNYMNS